MKKVVIVGCGFAGLNAAKRLSRGQQCEILVIDRENHHLFQPLLYQVAMATLSPAEIAVPIRGLLGDRPHVRVLKSDAKRIDVERQRVITEHSEHPFDYLLLACGAQHSYFGHEEWEGSAPGLKTLPQATEIRNRVLEAFEAAERESDIDRRRKHLTFVVVGAGPTGVELAGAIGEMSRYALAHDFSSIDPRHSRVVLVEAGPRILPTFDESLAAKAMRDLESLGVQAWTSARVTNVTDDGVVIGTDRLAASTVLWAAGVRPAPIGATLGTPLDRAGRVTVGEDLTIPGHRNIFVCGDLADARDEAGKPLPGVAAVAMQQGIHVAKMITADLKGRERRPFHYRDKGKMATIGRARAIAEFGRLRLDGRVAWWFWLIVHIYYLTGFRNRVTVLVQWAWSYLTFGRGARLIMARDWRSYADAAQPNADALARRAS